jgi:hypothetical protein
MSHQNGQMRIALKTLLPLITVLLPAHAQTNAAPRFPDELFPQVQAAVNWYRTWWGGPGHKVTRATASEAWAALGRERIYIALPNVELGIEFDCSSLAPAVRRIDPLVAGSTGPEAVQRFLALRRMEARFAADPRSDRFDRGAPRTTPAPEERFEVADRASIALPAGDNSPTANEADRSALVAALRSALRENALLSGARLGKAVVPRFAVTDPFVLVLLQKQRLNDPDFILACRPAEAGWRCEDVLLNRFGDLSDLIARIKGRAWETLNPGSER